MVSALVSRSNGLGSSLAMSIVLCSWEKHFTLTVPLSTQVYKWVLANLMLRGAVEILLVASCFKPIGWYADFPFTYQNMIGMDKKQECLKLRKIKTTFSTCALLK